jgi:tRNA(fMet)-specific endonuclease VapC
LVIRPRYLLDTDTCIYINKRRPPEVRRHMDGLPHGSVAMSAMTFGELMFGAKLSSQRDRVEQILAELARTVPVLAVSRHAAERYGELRAVLSRAGQPIGPNDLWLAAHALAEDLVLVTNNTREFSRVPDLRIENWVGVR